MSNAKKLVPFLRKNRKYWLWPILLSAVLAILLLLSVRKAAVAPFHYNIY